MILRNQFEKKEPVEAYQFFLSMRNRGCSAHEAVHLVEAILVRLIFSFLREGIPFDSQRYIFLLKKYKNRKPYKIHTLLDREFDEETLPQLNISREDAKTRRKMVPNFETGS